MSVIGDEKWRECSSWLTRVGLLPPDHRANWGRATMRDLACTLRDGVQLCRLLNYIKPNSLDLKDINQRPQMAQFLCLRNIRTFLQVCKEEFDLKDSELFQPEMLFSFTDFNKVLHTLSVLSNSNEAKINGIQGFSIAQSSCETSPTLEDLNFEDLTRGEEEIYEEESNYSVVVQSEEDIYQDLCYIDRSTRRRQPVTLREKRDFVKGELLDTETNYVDALKMLKDKFMKPLRNLLKEEEKQILFFGIKELNEIHNGFLTDLTRVLTTCPSTPSLTSHLSFPYGAPQSKNLGDVFCSWKEKFLIYGDYCANLTRAQALLEDLTSKNELINLEIAKCEREVNDGRFKLRDLLTVPMQRVLKYHLLLQKLLLETSVEVHGYDEYTSIERAHGAMNDIAEFTNEVKRDSETLSIIRQIEGSIYDLKMPDGMELKDYGRNQKDGELKIRGHDDNNRLKSRYVFIFDKVMIMCKSTRMVDKLLRVEQYSYKHSLCLQEYRVEDIPSTTALKKLGREPRWSFGWNLVHHKEKNVYTMYASTEAEKKRWIKAIEDALENIQPRESRITEHVMVMSNFDRGSTCAICRKLLKGLFYQGYSCIRCSSHVHRSCISSLRKCGIVQATPPELPPRPLLLPIPTILNTIEDILVSPTIPIPRGSISPPLPLNNLNSPSASNGSRLPPFPHPNYANLDHLDSYPWYGGEMEREEAEGLLERSRNGTFLVRLRPSGGTKGAGISSWGGGATDGAYALSFKWNDHVKHMRILRTADEKLYCLSESKYFKSIVELVHWYQNNSLAESFSGLDACLQRPFEKPNTTPTGIVQFDYGSSNLNSPSFQLSSLSRLSLTPS